MSKPELLRIENLFLHFRTSKGVVRAVDGVDLELGHNEAMVILNTTAPPFSQDANGNGVPDECE